MARECVYVIGAGFSAGLGYPLTHDLLMRLWPRLKEDFRKPLAKVIAFHHHGFDPDRFSSYPNVEHLLSQMAVNEDFFHMSRRFSGKFTREKLKDIQQQFLLEVADWFHSLSNTPQMERARKQWLNKFRDRVIGERAAIISFNWDLVLDSLLFGKELNAASYGFPDTRNDAPVLLKPHGSLNWFDKTSGRTINKDRRFKVHEDGEDAIYAFRKFTRPPKTSHDRTYMPLIVPPIYLKRFDAPIFKELWRKCTTELSTAKKVVFLGYSMPQADLHAEFIMRCGFHNQLKGELAEHRKRRPVTGAAEVVIVNPDRGAAERASSVASKKSKRTWISKPAADWIADADF